MEPPKSGLRLTNVRFIVEEGAKLSVGVAVDTAGDEAATTGDGSHTLTLAGAAPQGSDGGALEVKHGGKAMFFVPMYFDDNSVSNGYSGGGLHTDGEVTFARAVHFAKNRACENGTTVISSPSSSQPVQAGRYRRSCGGGVSLGARGRINFLDFASFEGNSAGRGGGFCNRGWAKFSRRTFFDGNRAAGENGRRSLPDGGDGHLHVGSVDEHGDGDGGAVWGEEGSSTIFTRRSTMLRNWAADSGGAIYNGGVMVFESSALFRGNEAAAAAVGFKGLDSELEAGGGHLFNHGYLEIKGDASFREGFSGNEGGAVYAISGYDTVLGGISTFEGNTASGSCKDIFAGLSGGEIRLTTITADHPAPNPLQTPTGDSAATSATSGTSAAESAAPVAADATPANKARFTSSSPTGDPMGSLGGHAGSAEGHVGSKPRRRVFRLDFEGGNESVAGSSEGGGGGGDGHRRERRTPCQP